MWQQTSALIEVEEILKKNTGKGKLAFVGDGINDAPVLSRADIGIAMGAMGSDAAIEAADIVLMDDDPLKISKAIRISRKCLRIVYENIWFAIGIKLSALCMKIFGSPSESSCSASCSEQSVLPICGSLFSQMWAL